MLERIDTPLKNCFLLKPSVFRDHRGIFHESYNKQRFTDATGVDVDFVQDNQSSSYRGVLRGLHFQVGDDAQAKLVRCVYGSIMDVVVDLRRNSPTFKKHFKVVLSDENFLQLFVPSGFAHGFITLSDVSVFAYKCDRYYNKESEGGIIWSDPELAIDWHLPQEELILSEKDAVLPQLKELDL